MTNMGPTNTEMHNRATFVFLAAALVLMLLLSFFFLEQQSGGSVETKGSTAKAESRTGSGSGRPTEAAPVRRVVSDAGSVSVPEAVANATGVGVSAGITRDAAMEQIFSAMLTYSDTGVEKLSAFLGSSDQDVRRAAVEALKQIRTASSAKVLRDAAKLARTKEERSLLSEAADFVELPVYDPKKSKDRKIEIRMVD